MKLKRWLKIVPPIGWYLLFFSVDFPTKIFMRKTRVRAEIATTRYMGLQKKSMDTILRRWWKKELQDIQGRKMDCFWILEEWPCVTWTSFCSYIIIYPWDWIHDQTIHWFEWSFSFAIYLLLLKENKKTLRYKLFSKHSNYICFFYKKKILYYIKRYLIKVWHCGILIFLDILIFIFNFFLSILLLYF